MRTRHYLHEAEALVTSKRLKERKGERKKERKIDQKDIKRLKHLNVVMEKDGKD